MPLNWPLKNGENSQLHVVYIFTTLVLKLTIKNFKKGRKKKTTSTAVRDQGWSNKSRQATMGIRLRVGPGRRCLGCLGVRFAGGVSRRPGGGEMSSQDPPLHLRVPMAFPPPASTLMAQGDPREEAPNGAYSHATSSARRPGRDWTKTLHLPAIPPPASTYRCRCNTCF